MAKVAINGLGRTGRTALKIILDAPELELVAANDIVPVDNLAYLLKYDTVRGRYQKSISSGSDHLPIDGKKFRIFMEKDLSQVLWKELGIGWGRRRNPFGPEYKPHAMFN